MVTDFLQEGDRHIRCPDCRCRQGYRLADGRRKCRRCGRRFTPGPHGNRLPPELLRRIALHFWLMVPAGRAAAELGLDRKTVQRYYRLLRRRLGGLPGGEEGARRGGEEGPVPVFAVVHGRGKVRLAAVPPGGGEGVVFAESAEALERLDLDRFFQPAGAAPGGVSGEPFWPFARRLLRRYRGGHRREFPLFVGEMAFRYNQRRNPRVVATLARLLQRG